jgi:hypothetical protein
VENHAPRRLVGHGGNTLGDDLRVPAGGRENLPGLQGLSDETQSREAAKSTGENEGDPHRPGSASSHDMIPALTSRSAILTAAGT